MKFFVIKINKILWIICLSIFLLMIIIINIFYFPTLASLNDLSNNNNFNYLFDNKEKVAYLTFDDGPSCKVTPKILDILKEKEIKASFFVIGKNVKTNPEIVERAYKEGHFIANHTYNHNNNIIYKSKETFLEEIKNTDKEIAAAIKVENYSSGLFRFPNGFMAPLYKNQKKIMADVLNEIDYSYVDWNCLNKDSEKKYSKGDLLNNLKISSKNKGTLVILMHDTGDVNNTFDVLEDSIEYLKSEGYTFKNFYDILNL